MKNTVGCVTHINAPSYQVVMVQKVVCDWLSKVEGQLDECKGRTSICGGEDDPSWIVHHWNICGQNHLFID